MYIGTGCGCNAAMGVGAMPNAAGDARACRCGDWNDEGTLRADARVMGELGGCTTGDMPPPPMRRIFSKTSEMSVVRGSRSGDIFCSGADNPAGRANGRVTPVPVTTDAFPMTAADAAGAIACGAMVGDDAADRWGDETLAVTPVPTRRSNACYNSSDAPYRCAYTLVHLQSVKQHPIASVETSQRTLVVDGSEVVRATGTPSKPWTTGARGCNGTVAAR